jgi:PadR family transcriptional regulator PadR
MAPGADSYSWSMEDIDQALRHPAALVGPCVLLLLAESPSHGYELVDRLKGFGFDVARTSSLYRELRRLEDDGLVFSYWEASQTRGPARRVYELTAPGRAALEACADGAVGLADTLEDYLGRYLALPRPRRRTTSRRGTPVRPRA